MFRRKLRTTFMPMFLRNMWYVNESEVKQSSKIFNSADFVRFSQIDKLLSECLMINGEVAELGVYQGRLTELIADKMKHTVKWLYLFDTFEGFDERDVKFDQREQHISGKVEDFSNTNVDRVVDRVLKTGFKKRYLQIRKGWFPSTIQKLDEVAKFCFVSIDFDLSRPTRIALDFFWPRMSVGGYIIVHDYGNKNYKGVKDSVDYFLRENRIKTYFELCDYCGSMIIKKV